jgi:hypothetical protein
MSAAILVFAIAAGAALSNSVVHCALGIQRPRSIKHLTFAALMLFIFPFQIASAGLYTSESPIEAVAMARAGVALAVVIILLYARFVEMYAEVTVPRWLAQAHIAVSVGWLLYDLLSPWGLLFAALPVTVIAPRGGPDVLFVRTPAIGLLWQSFNALTIVWGIAAGVRMARTGRRRAGIALVVGSMCVLGTIFFDIIKGVLGATWPYLGGFGIVVLALVLSAQLAADFRASEKRLSDMVAAALVLSDLLNTPLQTLEVGLETLNVESDDERARVLRLKRAVARLADVGRQLQTRSPLGTLIAPKSK